MLAVTLLSWSYLLYLGQHVPGMDDGPMMADMQMPMARHWSAYDALFSFGMWTVMMTGMMAASAAPVLALFAAAHIRQGGSRAPAVVIAFGFGYLLVWAGASAVAAALQWLLHETAMLSAQMAVSNRYAGGAILFIAGAYQLTPWKHACLARCRSPLGFLLSRWRQGSWGALQMGMRHGAYCLGCCWALMTLLFVVGIMNLAWVAALTLFVLFEKTGPAAAPVARIAGIAMLTAGVLLFLGIG